MTIPTRLTAACGGVPGREEWLARLPHQIQQLESRWSFSVARVGPFENANCAWVAPVTLADRTQAVLKLPMPHMEGLHEADGLRFWNGDPTVRLLRADPDSGAMLLERCEPGTPLRTLPEPEQDVVVATLLKRLHKIPTDPHPFRPLSEMIDYWSRETAAFESLWMDRGLVRRGLRLFEELLETGQEETVLATDLHAGNILRSTREPWLVIDPKPFVGDPAYDATQHLLNCSSRLLGDPRGTIRRLADLAGLDEDRIRLWLFARGAAEPRGNWNNDPLSELALVVAEP